METREFTATELDLDINRRYACLNLYWATANTNMWEQKQEWKCEETPKMEVKILDWAAHCMCSRVARPHERVGYVRLSCSLAALAGQIIRLLV